MLGCWPRGRCRWPKNDTKRLPAASASSSVEHRSCTGAPSLRSAVSPAGEKAVGTAVKRLYSALNTSVMRLVRTPLEPKELIAQIADDHYGCCPFSNVRPIRPNKRTVDGCCMCLKYSVHVYYCSIVYTIHYTRGRSSTV